MHEYVSFMFTFPKQFDWIDWITLMCTLVVFSTYFLYGREHKAHDVLYKPKW